MAIRISKKVTIILIVIAVLIVGGAGGYLLWRVNQEEEVSPTYTDAAGCRIVCNRPTWRDTGCEHGSSGCNCNENETGREGIPEKEGETGNLECCDDYTKTCPAVCGNGKCETGETVTSCAKDCATSCETYTTQAACDSEQISLDCEWYATVNECHVAGTAVCGDGTCNGTETNASCPDDCEAAVVEEEPSWVVTKTAVEECIGEGTETPTSEVLYTITIKNNGEGQGSIDKIIDNLDSKVLSSYVQSGISNGGTFSSGQILWELTGDAETFISGQQKTYTYTVVIPRTAFGSYSNTVTVYPKDSTTNITASKTITVDCDASGDVPQTGLFDSTVSKVVGGLLLVVIGLSFTKMTDIFSNSINTLQSTIKKTRISMEENRNERRKERFEKKISKKVK